MAEIMEYQVNIQREAQRATNLSVFIQGNTAFVDWSIEGDPDNVTGFELFYELVESSGTAIFTYGISRLQRTFRIIGLLPFNKYRIYMVTITDLGRRNQSEVVEFTTNNVTGIQFVESTARGIQLEEAIVLFIVVCLWACAMVLFVKQWDNIRILEPQEPRFKHSPKNLHTIRIVKKPQDSIIYKNYSRKMSLTMVEREKKLLRMNTVPIMESVSSLKALTSKYRSHLPTIEMEETYYKPPIEPIEEVTVINENSIA
ncbi:hypothetical protein DPMN_131172 [Dreissena polymorpha]|uniref:Fibronectin type-III domain-containing protein n=2 Tax=Dreissena polymorpha TaxID=45954 RepID=A0A9D4H629_DREPO|nr:hypothetical protein DPMN_131172 [Dreissena polymorpha]